VVDDDWLNTSELRGPAFADVDAAQRLVLIGAVELAAAVCRIARVCGWLTYVIDPRPRFATAERFPDATAVLDAWPQEALARLEPIDEATAIAALAHDPVLDDPALMIALRSSAGYVGAMGSRRTQEARRERLLAAGLTAAELGRLTGPAGLDLGTRRREETALSIVAEIVAARHGRAGGRLGAGAGSIRAAAP
jgi:xanthine dehydrogenase accessory factor